MATENRARDGGTIAPAPRGLERLKWLGPGLIWMIAAMGSGEMLFTPLVAAQHGYALLWAFLLAVTLKWFVNREIGRFAVCTGSSFLEGLGGLPGPGAWAVWLIVVPQLVVAVAAIAGFASSAGTAVVLVLPGPLELWTLVILVVSALLVVLGRYEKVELATRVFAVVLAGVTIAAAIAVAPALREIGAGLVPQIPEEADFGEILPWLGYALSGAAGLMWYSYWVKAKGYGAAGAAGEQGLDPKALSQDDQARLRGWLRQMTLDTSVAVVGAVLITLVFMILGAELLRPRGLVPAEKEVAGTLGELLGGVWGRVGFWIMVTGVLVGFWGTILSNQDGFGRLLGNGTRLLARRLGAGRGGRLDDELWLQRFFVIVWVTVLPAILFLIVGEPVGLLKLAGAIEAAHIPVVTGLILALNRRSLPEGLRPSRVSVGGTFLAVLFFSAFAAVYLYRLLTGAA